MDSFQRVEFGRLMVVLAETMREQVSDIAIDGYFSALQRADLADLQTAAQTWASTAKWFPKPSEWLEQSRACRRAKQEADIAQALPPSRDEPWHHDCEACEDDGWLCVTCGNIDCDPDAAPHERRMKPCPCRATNRTYQRHNQRKGAA